MPSEKAPNVGRVGALALALGAGAVIAAWPATAWADGTDGPADARTVAPAARTAGLQRGPSAGTRRSPEPAARPVHSGPVPQSAAAVRRPAAAAAKVAAVAAGTAAAETVTATADSSSATPAAASKPVAKHVGRAAAAAKAASAKAASRAAAAAK